MGLKEEILARRNDRKIVDVAVSSKGFARHNVPELGIIVAEDVESMEKQEILPVDEYYHAERKREITERISPADQTLLDGLVMEGAVYNDPDVAQQIAWEQLMEYRRDANVKPEAYAWELVWDHGK